MPYSNLFKTKKVTASPVAKMNITQGIMTAIICVLTLVCLLPMLLIVIVAFSSEASIAAKGFSFFPSGWSVKAFEYVATFGDQVINAYKITILETLSGTLLTLFLTGMFSYTLSRQDFMLRKPLAVYLLITMLFSGGLLGSFLVNSNVFHLRNNFLILILPMCITTWNCIVMRTFIQSNVPPSLIEAAKIDGAGEAYTYFKIVLPILLPVMAAIGFMTAIGHWNEWQTAFLYIDKPELATLQLILIRIEKSLSYLQQNRAILSAEEMEMLRNAPNESARMAVLLYTIGPIIVVYPFFQKYFIQGITVGSVKG